MGVRTMAAMTETIVYDASAVRSRSCRQSVEGTLDELSLARAEGTWQSIVKLRRRLPHARAVVVGDLHELTATLSLDDLAAGPSTLSYVLLVRTARDRKRLAEPDVALRLSDDTFFVFDLKGAEVREAQLRPLMQQYFRGFIERLQPDRVRTARFSPIDGILWLEFGDGLNRAIKWDSLPFARELKVTPLSASAREHGQSVQLVDAEGREMDIDAGALRAVVDPDHLRLIEGENGDLRLQMGARLRRVREQSGLSQQLVSERGGVAQESLSRIENGRRDPRLETLRKLAKGMDMTLPELLKSLSSSPDQTSGVTG
jgi:DNA-binding XRE family transcriptional regulator